MGDGQDLGKIAEAIANLDTVAGTETDDESRTLTALARDGSEPLHDIAALVSEKQWKIASLQMESGKLDDVFREITGGTSA